MMGRSAASYTIRRDTTVQSDLAEIAIGQVERMLQNRRRHQVPLWGIAPLGSSVGPPPADAA